MCLPAASRDTNSRSPGAFHPARIKQKSTRPICWIARVSTATGPLPCGGPLCFTAAYYPFSPWRRVPPGDGPEGETLGKAILLLWLVKANRSRGPVCPFTSWIEARETSSALGGTRQRMLRYRESSTLFGQAKGRDCSRPSHKHSIFHQVLVKLH